MSTSVVSEKVQENGAKEAEIVNIYEQARQNALLLQLALWPLQP